MKKIKPGFLDTSFFEMLVRLTLGLVFIYAGIHKILDPAAFAKIIYGYYLFPDFSINIIAITLPFIELACGISLLTGIFPAAASVISSVMLISFMIAISINLLRGHEFDCGCFSLKGGDAHSSAAGLLIRDSLYLAMALHAVFFKGQRIFSLSEKIHDFLKTSKGKI